MNARGDALRERFEWVVLSGGGRSGAIHRHWVDARGAYQTRSGSAPPGDAAKSDAKLKASCSFSICAGSGDLAGAARDD